MKKYLKKEGLVNILLACFMCAVGIVLFVNPERSLQIISYIVGAVFIAIGIVKIINYFLVKGKYDIFNFDLIYGIIGVLIGVIAICFMGTITEIFRVIAGVWIVYCGIIRLNLYIKFRTMNIGANVFELIISTLMIICGIYILASQGIIISTIGLILIVYAILDIIENIAFMVNISRMIEE